MLRSPVQHACFIAFLLLIGTNRGEEEALGPDSGEEGSQEETTVNVSSCTALQTALKDTAILTVVVQGAIQCSSDLWVETIILDRDVRIFGGSVDNGINPSIDWGNVVGGVAVEAGRKLLIANLIQILPSLQHALDARFATVAPGGAVFGLGVVAGLGSCSESVASSTARLEATDRPAVFGGKQEVTKLDTESIHVASFGRDVLTAQDQSIGTWSHFVCQSEYHCRVTAPDDPSILEAFGRSGVSTDCAGSLTGAGGDGGRSKKSSLFKWSRETLFGAAVAAGVALAILGFLVALFVRICKKNAADSASVDFENVGASKETNSGGGHLHSIEGDLLERVKKAHVNDVEVGTLIGRGGFGRVYKGTWKGTMVAIKLIEHEAALKSHGDEPLEAVLSKSMAHPNIVQTFSIHTATVDEQPVVAEMETIEEGSSDAMGEDTRGDIFSDMAHDHPNKAGSNQQLETMIILEYCDRGSLQQAIRNKLLNGSKADPNMQHVLLSALDVANAVSYLHSVGIIHGDLKAANVLLKSASTDQRGFICKVSDFGLARIMANETQLQTFTYGTVTHMPPELLKDGILTPAMDVYSFGLLLWELVANAHPYPGKNHGEIILGVIKGQRPRMPDNFPPEYAMLIENCWQVDYKLRPTFPEIVKRIKTLFVKCSDTAEALVRIQESRAVHSRREQEKESNESGGSSNFSEISLRVTPPPQPPPPAVPSERDESRGLLAQEDQRVAVPAMGALDAKDADEKKGGATGEMFLTAKSNLTGRTKTQDD